MKNQSLFSSKDKSKKLKCRLQKFLFGTLRVNVIRQKQRHIIVSNTFTSGITEWCLLLET